MAAKTTTVLPTEPQELVSDKLPKEEVQVDVKNDFNFLGMQNPTREIFVSSNDGNVPMSVREYLQYSLIEKKNGTASNKLVHISGKTSFIKLQEFQEMTNAVPTVIQMIDISVFATLVSRAFEEAVEIIDNEVIPIFPAIETKTFFLVCKLIEDKHITELFANEYANKGQAGRDAVTKKILKRFKEFAIGYLSFHIDDVLHFPAVNAYKREDLLNLLPENLKLKLQ